MPVMNRDFFDPPWEQTNIVLVDLTTLRKAEDMIESCEHEAEIPFDNILDSVT
jgi:hypothetical protein